MRALCLGCLKKHPQAPFGERLRAFRLAAGLTLEELAKRARTTAIWLTQCEYGAVAARWDIMRGLIGVLGVGLVTLGLEPKPKRQPRPSHPDTR
jgi:transcriptional regulator with XRE-family HTH domain